MYRPQITLTTGDKQASFWLTAENIDTVLHMMLAPGPVAGQGPVLPDFVQIARCDFAVVAGWLQAGSAEAGGRRGRESERGGGSKGNTPNFRATRQIRLQECVNLAQAAFVAPDLDITCSFAPSAQATLANFGACDRVTLTPLVPAARRQSSNQLMRGQPLDLTARARADYRKVVTDCLVYCNLFRVEIGRDMIKVILVYAGLLPQPQAHTTLDAAPKSPRQRTNTKSRRAAGRKD